MGFGRAARRCCRSRWCTVVLSAILCCVALFALSSSFTSLRDQSGVSQHRDSDAAGSSSDAGAQFMRRKGGRRSKGSGRKKTAQDDDEDVQICRYSTSVLDFADVTDDDWIRDEDPVTCQPEEQPIFYVDQGTIVLDEQALGDGSIELCEFRSIGWNKGDGFAFSRPLTIRSGDDFTFAANYDFIHVHCHLDMPVGVKKQKIGLNTREKRKAVERSNDQDGGTLQDFRYRKVLDAKAFHKSVIHNNSPEAIGSIGLPDIKVVQSRDVRKHKAGNGKETRRLLSTVEVVPSSVVDVGNFEEEEIDRIRGSEDAGKDMKSDEQFKSSNGQPEINIQDLAEDSDSNPEQNDEKEPEPRGETIPKNAKTRSGKYPKKLPDDVANALNKVEDSKLYPEEIENESVGGKFRSKSETTIASKQPENIPVSRRRGSKTMDQVLLQVSERDEVWENANKTKPNPNSFQMDVLLLTIDSMSQLSFQTSHARN